MAMCYLQSNERKWTQDCKLKRKLKTEIVVYKI